MFQYNNFINGHE